jgi:Mitochondrial carrier protein
MSSADSLGLTCCASAAAGIIGRVSCHPLDTLKARLQGPYGGELRGMSHAFRRAMAEEGVSALYRGLGAAVVGGTPGTMIYLTSWAVAKKQLETLPGLRHAPFLGHFISGMVAETVW